MLEVSSNMEKIEMEKWREDLDRQGFLVLEGVLSDEELNLYCGLYEDFMTGKLDASNHRHDLGSHAQRKVDNCENITQIMWPSLYLGNAGQSLTDLGKSPIHAKSAEIAKSLLGDDMEFDFDMLIAKEPKTDTETPWHSDEAYWIDLPDKRALSFWFPMQDVNVENGCMWFVPGSHKTPLKKHRPTKDGEHVLMTDEVTNVDGVAMPVKRGGCTVHTGRTLHYAGGNKTDKSRRAYIVNFRPKAMVDYERQHNYDHGKASFSDAKLKGKIHAQL